MSKPIIFHVTRCESRDETLEVSKDESYKQYVCYLYGRTYQNNKSICVVCKGYTPYIYIGIPPDMDPHEYKELILEVIEGYIDFLVRRGIYDREYSDSIDYDKCRFLKMTDFSGYRGNEKTRLLRLVFKNERVMRSVGNYLSKIEKRQAIVERLFRQGKDMTESFVRCKVYDELRFDNKLKLCHIRNTNPAGWVQVNNYKVIKNNPRTKQSIELECSFRDISDVTDQNFDKNRIPKLVMLSYDGEMYSMDDLLPQHNRPSDVIIQMGTIFRRYGEKESYKKIVVTQKKCGKLQTPKTTVLECKNERELILKWAKVIEKINPDIIYGYNTFGFDDQYIVERAKFLGIKDTFLNIVSRCNNWTSTYVNKELTSSGLGQNFLKYIDMRGRITIDIMKEIMKNVAYKFPSYTLNYVSQEFIGDKKNDLPAYELFDKFKRGHPDDIAIITDYCIQDCELVHNLVAKLAIIPSNIGMARVCRVGIDYIINRGQGIKILSLLAHQIMQMPLEKRFITEYKTHSTGKSFGGAIVLYPKIGIYNEDPVVVIDFNSLYPSIMIGHNMSPDTFVKDEKYIKNEDDFDELHFVDKETCKKVKVKFLKYNSDRSNMGILPKLLQYLLASRKKVKNEMALITDHYTLVKKILEELKKDSNYLNNFREIIRPLNSKLETFVKELKIDFGHFEIVGIEEKGYVNIKINTKNSQSDVDWKSIKEFKLTYNGKTTVIDIFNYQKTIDDLNSQRIVLNALQIAYKITANSVYGQCGAPTSSLYCVEIASVVTTYGQLYIGVAKKQAEDKYDADCVYGDTDSVFLRFPIKIENRESKTYEKIRIEKLLKAKALGYKISKEITTIINKPPIKIAYEKAILPLILMGKKNYCGLWHEEDVYKSKFKMMGCKAKKREYAPIVKKLFMGLIDRIVYSKDLEKSLIDGVEYFYKRCKNLNKYPIKYFVITKSLKKDYKNPKQIAHKVLADRITKRDPGNAPRCNQRLAYTFIDIDPADCTIDMLGSIGAKRKENGSTLIYKEHVLKGYRIETPDYIKKNKLSIDYEEYIIKQIAVPILSVLRLEISMDALEYMFNKITGKDVAIRIKENKRIIYTTGEEEITESVMVKVMKKNRNKIYKIPNKDMKYINFIKSFNSDFITNKIELID